MNEYKDLYTEDIKKASAFRHNYLESVLALSDEVAEEKKCNREEYISFLIGILIFIYSGKNKSDWILLPIPLCV